MLTLQFKSGDTIIKDKKFLSHHFSFFDDLIDVFPTSTCITLEITSDDWKLVDDFVSYLEIPTTPEKWIPLIEICDYLDLNPRYCKILIKDAKMYAIEHGAILYKPKKIILLELAEKIRDPKYILPSERCKWITRMENGENYYCDDPVALDQDLCSRCIRYRNYIY